MFVNPNFYQIIANTVGTIVNVAEQQQYVLNSGEYAQISVTGAGMLSSNYPIMLVQFGQVSRIIVESCTRCFNCLLAN